MATVQQRLTKAIREQNSVEAGRIADRLRGIFGLNYHQIYTLAHRWTGIELSDWDYMMAEADALESLSAG